MNSFTMQENSPIILQKGEYLKSCSISSDKFISLSNRNDLKVRFKAAVGEPFGTTFQLIPTEGKNSFDLLKISSLVSGDTAVVSESSGQDNRDLKDDGSSQKLTKDEILEIQKKGASGEELVQAIVANSSTFGSKTVYSQEKYLAKKNKKYSEPVTLHKPSLDLVADMLFLTDPSKVSVLRVDSLFQILSQCNVHPGARGLIHDSNSQCLVTAGLLQRLGQKGKLVNVFTGDYSWATNKCGAIKALGLTEDELSIAYHIHSDEIANVPCPQFGKKTTVSEEMEVTDSEREIERKIEDPKQVLDGVDQIPEQSSIENGAVLLAPENTVSTSESPKKEILSHRDNCHHKNMKFMVRTKASDRCLSRDILSEGVSTLVICSKGHPLPELLQLLPFLQPGCPFVIFSPHNELLAEVFQALKELSVATNVKLTETWMREYQVLPERTHPDVNMSSTGGFILTATKVTPPNFPN